MADISMCIDEECPKKMQCYRYTAPTNNYWQSYLMVSPRKEDGTCEMFWDNTGYANAKEKK